MSEPLPSIHADFNDHIGDCLRLRVNRTLNDLQRLGIVLREGLALHVSDDDLAADGIVHWSSELGEWVILLDNRTMTGN